ncbi:MAG: hypothetical protein ACE5EH_07315 [Gammaproteobacteria bacterium]
MSFCTKRNKFVALSLAVCSVLLQTGCAEIEFSKPPALPADAGQGVPVLQSWQSIGGGIEGNAFTGVADVRLVNPVAVAARGNFVYIVDSGREQLLRYEHGIERFTEVLDLRDVVSGEVSDIYLAGDLSFYLTDTLAGRVLRFDRNGVQQQVIQDTLNLRRPVAVSVDEETGYVYIADASRDHIVVFNQLGALLGSIGQRGRGQGTFLNITSMAISDRGIYVGTRFDDRVQMFHKDGTYLKSFQKNTITFPTAIAVDKDDNEYVSDYIDNTIKVYREGRLVNKIGGTGSGPSRFKRITDLWIDGGFLYVADSLNARIQILRISSN